MITAIPQDRVLLGASLSLAAGFAYIGAETQSLVDPVQYCENLPQQLHTYFTTFHELSLHIGKSPSHPPSSLSLFLPLLPLRQALLDIRFRATRSPFGQLLFYEYIV